MNNINQKISIIFPSYNGEKFLYRNINSIKNLSNLNEIELVIIDNNSSDLSKEIICSYKKDINIRLIELSKNVGFAKACNIGALNAKGDFIFTTNQDVEFPPEFFNKLIKIYNLYKKDAEVLISPAIIFETDEIHYFGAKIHFLGLSYTSDIKKKLPKHKIVKITQRFSGGALFIKKKLFLDMGGFDTNFFMYCEDSDLSLRILRKGLKIYTTNNPYLIHQKHDWTFNDFRYFLLERNRFIVFIKNISNFKKLFPFFVLTEIILLIHSIMIRKFGLRIRIYYELLKRIKYFKKLREKSKKDSPLFPYQKLSKKLDPVLIGDSKFVNFLNEMLLLYNLLLALI